MSRNLERKIRWIIYMLMTVLAGVVFPLRTSLANNTENLIVRSATITNTHGSVQVMKVNTSNWIPAEKGMLLYEGDRIKTSTQSSADLNIQGGETSEVRLVENTDMTFERMIFDNTSALSDTLLNLAIGKILVTSENLSEGSKYNVQTPTSLVGIRGTMFEVEVS